MIPLLPNGTIILLKGETKKLMIYGRKQRLEGSDLVYDYLGCLYPEGYIDPAHSYVFNHDDIETVVFQGFMDEEEARFSTEVLS
ncbi:DUF4176 domain-containing protein [Bacillus tianshenii]|uniref:DUF4176 domain-containing protein n=1 Tax=Sutcliffiella tianshenii TaxID=1463404 RepID=UPI001CD472EF|nr:DUF4176 domain-containing protein [Bacillus tianshenii]MCA1321617.1 DUF4176 domain-containing protein [Bacillus tianshenii]